MKMSIFEAFRNWESNIKPLVVELFGEDDEPALSESWNDYTDSLCKDGDLNDLQYQYCPAWDDSMPDNDREHILESMAVTVKVTSIESRPDGLMSDPDSNHWGVSIKRVSNVVEIFYSTGKALSEPDLEDIIGSLLIETCDIDSYVSFEDWAVCLGYDPDSRHARHAERVYDVCKELSKKLDTLFKESELSDLRELYEDF